MYSIFYFEKKTMTWFDYLFVNTILIVVVVMVIKLGRKLSIPFQFFLPSLFLFEIYFIPHRKDQI